jgi:membrane protease YdiL (CAAX protease family)
METIQAPLQGTETNKTSKPSRALSGGPSLIMTRNILLLLIVTFLFLLLAANGLEVLCWYSIPKKMEAFVLFLNNLPGGNWFESDSTISWHGDQLDYHLYSFLFFEVIPSSLFILICLALLRAYKISYQDIGLRKTFGVQGNLASIKIGLLSAVVMLALAALFLKICVSFGLKYKFVKVDWEFWFESIFLAPLREEFFFRGIFFVILSRYMPNSILLPLSAVFFGMLHLASYQSFMVVLAGVMGFYFGWLYIRTRSLILPILAHMISNAMVTSMVWKF